MNPVLLDLGFIKIYWYSVMILLGLLIGGTLVIKESKRYKIPEDYINNMLLYLIIVSILGARLYYVAFNWSYYSNNIIEIFKIWEGGLAIHGGIIAGLIFIVFYTHKYHANTFKILDMMVVGLIIGQAIGRWGNFFNGEAHGMATSLEFLNSLHLPNFIIEGMNIFGVYYHPTFLYESLWCIIGFIILLIIRRLKYCKIGQLTGFYLIWYGIGRFFIEGMRTDSLMMGSFRIAQIISIIMIVIGLIIMIVKGRGSKLENKYNDMENIDEIRF
ncbi:MAG: prolipoprotein diacylglyceryl transferase [Bacilli bacterium]